MYGKESAGASYRQNFQVILYEGSNIIRFNYNLGRSSGSSRNVAGIENQDGSIGLRYPGIEGTSFNNGLSVVFYPPDSILPSSPDPKPSPQLPELPEVGGDEDLDADGYTALQGDCNDHDPIVYPGAEEICGDGVDNNCDGRIDEECTSGGVGRKYYFPLFAGDESVFVGLVNGQDEDVSGILQAFDSEGELLESSDKIIIKGNGRIEIELENEFSTQLADIAYVVFTGEEEAQLNGYCRLLDKGDGAAACFPARLRPEAGNNELFVPRLLTQDGWRTEISFIVLSDKRMTAEVVFNNGDKEGPFLIDPGQEYRVIVENTSASSASVKISSWAYSPDDVLVGAVLYRHQGKMASVGLNGQGSRQLIVPYLVDQDGWWSSMMIYNPAGDQECDLKGEVTIRGQQPSTIESMVVVPGVTVGLTSKDWLPGACALEFDNQCALLGTGFIGLREDAVGAYSLFAKAQHQGSFARLQEMATSHWSGLVLYNPSDNDVKVKLLAYDEVGKEVASQEHVIEGNASLVGVFERLLGRETVKASHVTFISNGELYGLLVNYQEFEGGKVMVEMLPSLNLELN